MKINQRLVESFYNALISQNNFTYNKYLFKFNKKDIKVKLISNKKELAYWNIEDNFVESFLDEADVSEKKFIKIFYELPKEAEKIFQKKKQEREENSIPRRQEVLYELEDSFATLKDNEVTKENIDSIISKIKNNWLYEWFEKDANADKYADNLYMNELQTDIWVNIILGNVSDKRVLKVLGGTLEGKTNIAKDDEDGILLRPKFAQREGNLVTVTEIDHIRFTELCKKAIKFASEQVNKNFEQYKGIKEIQINWWEKDGKFYFNEDIDKNNPKTFRELIISKLDTILKKRPKPSRILLDIVTARSLENDFKLISHQYGKLEWNKTN